MRYHWHILSIWSSCQGDLLNEIGNWINTYNSTEPGKLPTNLATVISLFLLIDYILIINNS